MTEPKLNIQVGFSSLQGRREDNQDFGSYTQPNCKDAVLHGWVAAVADGMGGAKGGRVAAETCVRSFFDGFYSVSETLGVEPAAAKCLAAINSWIHAQGQKDPNLAGMATTFSALILRGRQAHLIHVGDSRIYRLRDKSLEKLTEDHTSKQPDMAHILYRAVGIENALRTDCDSFTLEAHDRFLLCSDGLHAALREADIRQILLARAAPDSSAQALTDLALAKGSQDNITALVVDVIGLPPPDRSLLRETLTTLPLRELPSVGETVDGYALQKLICTGRYSSLFQAQDTKGGSAVVLKFPHPNLASESDYYSAFVREAWIGCRVHSPWVAETVAPAPSRQSRLYTVMPFYDGDTLELRINRGQPVGLEEGVVIGQRLCKAIHALHRLRIIHRDIKPDNILLLAGGGLKLLDLGVARLPAFEEDLDAPIPGTPSYMAPEQFNGERGNEASDQFAAAATLYRLFAGGPYPYGEIEPFTHPRFHGRLKSLSVCRPDLPAWLDAVLALALAIDPNERYADIIELAYELENGLAKGGQIKPQKRAWYERNPLLFWKLTSAILFCLLMVCAAKLVLCRG
jgi:serine/threonine protein phosphatase PrpC